MFGERKTPVSIKSMNGKLLLGKDKKAHRGQQGTEWLYISE